MELSKDEIIRMAREACAPNQTFNSDEEWVKRFAALVAAHEREKIPKDFVKACEVLVQEKIDAVLAEREACAKSVYDSTDWAHEERDMVLKEAIAAAIRARGEK